MSFTVTFHAKGHSERSLDETLDTETLALKWKKILTINDYVVDKITNDISGEVIFEPKSRRAGNHNSRRDKERAR